MSDTEGQKVEVVIGGFYQTPQDKVVKVFRYSSKSEDLGAEIGYYMDDQQGVRYISLEDFSAWTRLNICDFPDAKDPILPYSFDLFFDIKYTSELHAVLTGEVEHDEIEEIRQMANEVGIEEDVINWGKKTTSKE